MNQQLFANKWLRRVLWLVGGIALVWALSWLTFPWLVKHQLQKQVSAQLGRAFTVGTVDFRPWTLELTITDMALAGLPGQPPQVALKRLYVNAEMESLLRLAPVVSRLDLDEPRLRLTHLGAGKYDIDDILARLAGADRAPGNSGGAPGFALFNLSLRGGAFDFDDRPPGRTHALRDLALGIPFLSNLAARRDVVVEPRLAFSLNGSRFESTARTTPFAPGRQTEASLVLRDVDLAPYLPYLPADLPVRLQQAVLEADLQLAFEQQQAAPVVKLSGSVQLSGVKVADRATQELLAFDTLNVVLDEARPLERFVKVKSVELTGPRLEVQRDAAGRLNLDFAASGTATPARATAPAVSVPASAASAPVASASAAPGPVAASPPADPAAWKVEVASLALRNGAANWSDASVVPRAGLLARELQLDVSGITWPLAQPLVFEGSLAVSGGASPGATGPQNAAPARVRFSGTGTDRQATVKVALEAAPLALGAPYLAQFLHPAVRGQLAAEMALQWQAPDLQVALQSLVLSDLALVPASAGGKGDLASVKRIQVSQANIDLSRQQVTVGALAIEQPRLAVERGPDKRWMFEQWLRPTVQPVVAAPASASVARAPARQPVAASGASAPAWNLVLADLSVDGGAVSFLDQAVAKPVAFGLVDLKLLAKNVSPDARQPSPLQLSARVTTPRGSPGKLDYRGTLQMQPLLAQGAVVATQLPVHAFEPYFGAGLNIELLRADTSFKGDVRYAAQADGPVLRVAGDVVLEDFRANSLAAGDGGLQIAEELLSWKALNLRGLEVALAPAKATTVMVRETTLSDFFARVIIFETGRINLQDLVKSDPAPAVATAPAAATSAPPTSAPTTSAPTTSAPTTGAPAGGAPVVAALQPIVNIGPISLINGKAYFSDRFVKPNYSANLSDLTGSLSAFSSVAPEGQPQLADLELRGRAEGTASLEVLGKLNPLARPLALDIKGKMRDLELPPLSPYSVKYAGHGIERGKLSVDVAYLVLPNGQLTASNKLVLNQLTFGDKVDGAPASLPVRLAVALLADRNGVIDIDLPVSGSLNDPEFRLGPIIFKIIVNVIVKAITAPFSLLASAFGGGGDELGTVAFAPGSAVLSADARAGLDKVARALTDRPALRMTVVGTSSLEAEREAFKRERLHALLAAEKRRALVTSGASAEALASAGALEISQEERSSLLQEVFRRADLPKPRDAAGQPKEVPPPEMEALLLANIPVTDEAMRELALRRGVAVKDYLSTRDLPVERLFLGAVKPVQGDEKWSPRAELVLADR